MKDIVLCLVVVSVLLCFLVGAFLQSWLFLGLSLGCAMGAWLLNKVLEHRHMLKSYKNSVKARPAYQTRHEEINAPDFFN